MANILCGETFPVPLLAQWPLDENVFFSMRVVRSLYPSTLGQAIPVAIGQVGLAVTSLRFTLEKIPVMKRSSYILLQ